MRISTRTIAVFCVLSATAIGGVCTADDCTEIDSDGTIADLLLENEGGKVLKVEETIDAQGCIELKVRILVNGTVKAITIPNETGA